MTTNKTIDGVPRELLSEWLKALNSRTSVPVAIRKMRNELRSLLDAPSVQWLAMEVNGKPWVIKEGPNADKWRAMGYELFPVEPATQPQGATSEVVSFGIQVEKMLCEALGREWAATGISIESLVSELKVRAGAGEPVYMVRTHGSCCWEEMQGESLEMCQAQPGEYEVRKLYAEQPAPVAVVLPERKPVIAGLLSESNTHNQGWNACLDEVASLNTVNDGKTRDVQPCCGSCPGGCVIQAATK